LPGEVALLDVLAPLDEAAELVLLPGGQADVRLAAVARPSRGRPRDLVRGLRRPDVLALQAGDPAADEPTGRAEEDQQKRVQEDHGSPPSDEVTALASRCFPRGGRRG